MLPNPVLPSLLIHDCQHHRWLEFTRPERVVTAFDLAGVLPALHDVDQAVRHGKWAAGFITYEAAPAFDPAMVTHLPVDGLPLVWFGIFLSPPLTAHPPTSHLHFPFSSPFLPSLPEINYHASIARIKDEIAAGNTYQVNYTMRMRAQQKRAQQMRAQQMRAQQMRAQLCAPFTSDPLPFFLQLAEAQQTRYAAYIHTGQYAICSASPELFFELDGERLHARPMKGTAPRGRTLAEDRTNAKWLHASEKNRAENVMIVDMIRNDMGRIAEVGSVHVPKLFEIERYPTVLQMTSTVECRTRASLPQIFAAMFPCASITGAPKIRTMQIIRELEPEPRGIYTGTIGFVAPGGHGRPVRAQFNVAIRTVNVDMQTGQAEYGTGSGIVWDSDPADEYRECLLKTRVLAVHRPAFELLESLLWTPEGGYFLLERHLARLRDSAQYFDYPFDEEGIQKKMAEFALSLPFVPHKIRLLLNSAGKTFLEAHPLPASFDSWGRLRLSSVLGRTAYAQPSPQDAVALRATLAASPISSNDIFLFHKTTHRQVYEQARAARPGFDEVLLWNERGEVTEFTASNIVIQLGKQCFTPPVACGLLGGTFRAALLENGMVKERVICLKELEAAETIWAINSVRGWRRVECRWLTIFRSFPVGRSSFPGGYLC